MTLEDNRSKQPRHVMQRLGPTWSCSLLPLLKANSGFHISTSAFSVTCLTNESVGNLDLVSA